MSKDWKLIAWMSVILTIITIFIIALVWLMVWEATTVIAEGIVMDWKETPRLFGGGYNYQVLLCDGKWYEIQENAYFVLQLGDYIQVLKNGAIIIL